MVDTGAGTMNDKVLAAINQITKDVETKGLPNTNAAPIKPMQNPLLLFQRNLIFHNFDSTKKTAKLQTDIPKLKLPAPGSKRVNGEF